MNTPWTFVEIEKYAGYGKVLDSNGQEIMNNIPYSGNAPSNDYMMHIVQCVNAHTAKVPSDE